MADGQREVDRAQAQAAEVVPAVDARPATGMMGSATAAFGSRAIQRKLVQRRRAGSGVQRQVREGWGGRGWNAGAHTVGEDGQRDPAAGGVQRIPLDGLPTSDFPQGKAIVIVSAAAQAPGVAAIEALVHYHGHGEGYFSARDVTRDDLDQQIAAAGRPMIGILPQLADAPGHAGGSPGHQRTFNAERSAQAVFTWLRAHTPPLVRADQTLGRVILSGHSAGGRPATAAATADATTRPDAAGGLFLFDGHVNFDTVSHLLGERLSHDRAQLVGDPAATPPRPPLSPADQLAYLQSRGFVFRAFGSGGGYTSRHANPRARHGSDQEADYQGGGHGGPQGTDGAYGGRTQRLHDYLEEWFAAPAHVAGVDAAALTRWRANYQSTARDGTDHDTMVSHGDGDHGGRYAANNASAPGRQGHLEQAARGAP